MLARCHQVNELRQSILLEERLLCELLVRKRQGSLSCCEDFKSLWKNTRHSQTCSIVLKFDTAFEDSPEQGVNVPLLERQTPHHWPRSKRDRIIDRWWKNTNFNFISDWQRCQKKGRVASNPHVLRSDEWIRESKTILTATCQTNWHSAWQETFAQSAQCTSTSGRGFLIVT